MIKKYQILLSLLLSALLAVVVGWMIREQRASQSPNARKIIEACQREQFDPQLWCRSRRLFQDHAAQASRKAIAIRLPQGIQIESATILREIECMSPSETSLLVHVLAMQERTGIARSEAIRHFLGSPVAEVRRHAVEAVGLEELRSYDAEIRTALQASDPEVRTEAVETAISLQWPDIRSQLENARKDRDTQVRKTALQGMIHLDRLRAMELLEEVNRKDPDEGIRNWAHEALKFLGSHEEDQSTQEEKEALQKHSTGIRRE